MVNEIQSKIVMHPIGHVRTDVKELPTHWTVSNVEGELVVDQQFQPGLQDLKIGQKIIVIFCFHESPVFTSEHLVQKPRHIEGMHGVFGICSPIRPNPIGMSVVKLIGINENKLTVKGLDMRDQTPILDIKPYR